MKWVNTKNQKNKILQYDEKYLSSYYDPIKESIKWIHSLNKYVLKKDHFLVLGCGSGYHIDQLDRLGLFKSIHVLCLSSKQKQLIEESFQYSESVVLHSSKELSTQLHESLNFKSFGLCEISTDKVLDLQLYNKLKAELTQRNTQFIINNKDFKLQSEPEDNELLSVKHVSYIKNPTVDKIMQELVK